MNIHQQSRPLGDHKYRGNHYHRENKTKGGKQIEFCAESNQFEKNQSGNKWNAQWLLRQL